MSEPNPCAPRTETCLECLVEGAVYTRDRSSPGKEHTLKGDKRANKRFKDDGPSEQRGETLAATWQVIGRLRWLQCGE